jgi:hypothetical protein
MQQGMGTWHWRIAMSKTTDLPNQAEYADDCFFIPFVITLVGWLPSLIAATCERVAPRKTAELHGTRLQITEVFLSPKSATPQRISRMEKAAVCHCTKQHS